MFVCVWYLVSEHYMNSWFQVSWPQVQNEMDKSSVDMEMYVRDIHIPTQFFFKVSISKICYFTLTAIKIWKV